MLSKEEIDQYLQLLGEKVLSKYGPEAKVKLVVAGGAAIALNYAFRESTMDVDTYSRYASELEDSVREVAEEVGIECDWLSHNIMVTQSCSPKIENYASRYKLYCGVLDVHTVDALTLICMKSVSCRPDSHDMEDIVNLLDVNESVTFKDIRERFISLYGDWSQMKADAQMYLCNRFKAMPPDMIDTIAEYLPPSVCSTLNGEALYEACQEVYRRIL